ncbi:hypothetical protein DEU56DRAFT_757311 [Suillus clintonianus]|uniref:uncharacterized protein n=1 Tax=Suillus clintonianus TaxID=1904413 RepID=UPI001B871CAC|nr:uncharacterized protein DEU56DRAFT_757311 [Suillus clintonianus]KAG2132820.1 hypothetical protein DEU56DRAFT_757311 [Suillus clintonianus]
MSSYTGNPPSRAAIVTTQPQGSTLADPFATRSDSDTMRTAAIAMNDEQKESERMKAKPEVIRAQASRTTPRQSRKRKPDQRDKSDKENTYPTPAPAAKRIRREKTGTEWQTVLDLVKFGEEQRSKQNGAASIEEMKA